MPMVSIAEALALMISFGMLILAILSFDRKK
ncbi:putative holin-like toxin [Alkalihalobacillus pseudalcaliphilus]|nr:putative holin-like toxin [Alkalihalobacillus pseudalcaliphilus]